MATTKDGYTHNADGTYSYKGQVIPGVKSLQQARNYTANPNATGGDIGGKGGSGPRYPNISGSAFTSPSSSLQGDFAYNTAAGGQGNLIQNGNYVNDLTDTQVTIDPKTGQPTQTTHLSDANRNVVTGLQNSAQRSNANLYNNVLNGGALNGFAGASTPGQAATSDPYTEAVFGQLTNHLNQNYQQQKQDKAQELQNRGIPQGSDEWTREMQHDVEQPYNDSILQAQNQAVTSGASMQNQSAGTLQNIGSQGYITQTGAPALNNVNYAPFATNPTQVGQVFGTLANNNLSAQAQMVGAKAAGMGAATNATLAGAAIDAINKQNQGGAQSGSTQPPTS